MPISDRYLGQIIYVLTFGFHSGVRQLQYIVVVNAKSQIILSTDLG